jgi:PAS domain S-box-containing protein
MDIFKYLTPIIYWLLILMWTGILLFYIHRMFVKEFKRDLISTLILILAIDAFRTLFESFYFGLWYTSLSGLIPKSIHDFLILPENVLIPKLLNVVAAGLIIALLIRKWLPEEEGMSYKQAEHLHLLEKQIKERKRIEKKLRESEERYRSLYENSLVALFRINISDGTIFDANITTAQILGYKSVNALLQDQCKVSDFYTDTKRSSAFRKLKRSGKLSNIEFPIHFENRTIHLSLSAQLYVEKGYIEGAAIDITNHKKVEAAMRERDRLQGVLEMAGAISHELNQPLQNIFGYSELISMELKKDHYLVEKIKVIKEQADRIGKITKKLTGITRYRTKDYIKGEKIIDLDRSSNDEN